MPYSLKPRSIVGETALMLGLVSGHCPAPHPLIYGEVPARTDVSLTSRRILWTTSLVPIALNTLRPGTKACRNGSIVCDSVERYFCTCHILIAPYGIPVHRLWVTGTNGFLRRRLSDRLSSKWDVSFCVSMKDRMQCAVFSSVRGKRPGTIRHLVSHRPMTPRASNGCIA